MGVKRVPFEFQVEHNSNGVQYWFSVGRLQKLLALRLFANIGFRVGFQALLKPCLHMK